MELKIQFVQMNAFLCVLRCVIKLLEGGRREDTCHRCCIDEETITVSLLQSRNSIKLGFLSFSHFLEYKNRSRRETDEKVANTVGEIH